MNCYDAHSHNLYGQKGGILIGMEGQPYFNDTLSNEELLRINNDNFLLAFYIEAKQQLIKNYKIIKLHPRREKYSSAECESIINFVGPNIVIIDTLNFPFWNIQDYARLIMKFPDKTFLLPHAGGYDMIEFIKLLDFYKNVWIDFSMSHEYFGWCGSNPKNKIICSLIDYTIKNEKLNNRVLFGSDSPFFSFKNSYHKYRKLKTGNKILLENFIRFRETTKT